MIRLDVEIKPWAHELLYYPTEWDYELTHWLKYAVKDNYPELYRALSNLQDATEYITYDSNDIDLVDAEFNKGPYSTITFILPVELDDEALLRDYGN